MIVIKHKNKMGTFFFISGISLHWPSSDNAKIQVCKYLNTDDIHKKLTDLKNSQFMVLIKFVCADLLLQVMTVLQTF